MARYDRSFAGEHRTEGLRVQLTPSERAELEWAAARQGATLSTYVRELCMRRSAAVIAATPRNPEAKELRRELAAIGNNVNQIALRLNTTNELRHDTELRETLNLIKRAMAKVLAA